MMHILAVAVDLVPVPEKFRRGAGPWAAAEEEEKLNEVLTRLPDSRSRGAGVPAALDMYLAPHMKSMHDRGGLRRIGPRCPDS